MICSEKSFERYVNPFIVDHIGRVRLKDSAKKKYANPCFPTKTVIDDTTAKTTFTYVDSTGDVTYTWPNIGGSSNAPYGFFRRSTTGDYKGGTAMQKLKDYAKYNSAMYQTNFTKAKLKTIKPILDIVGMVQGFGFVAGGAARFALSENEYPAQYDDIDVFTYDEPSWQKLHRLFEDKWEETNETDFATTFEDEEKTIKIQLIKCQRSVEETNMTNAEYAMSVLEKFDIRVCGFALLDRDTALKLPFADRDEKERVLIIQTVYDPIYTMSRITKYTKRGYKVPVMEIAKLFRVYSKLDDAYKIKMDQIIDKEEKQPDTARSYMYDFVHQKRKENVCQVF